MKRGQIWISAVLYIALGVILITIILAAGVPLIEKIRDRNTFLQTKEMMFAIDDNIKTVATEGTGSKRFLSTLNIDRGELIFDVTNNEIKWTMNTQYKSAETGIDFKEGPLILTNEETNVKDEYLLSIKLNYTNIISLELESDFQNPFKGTYSMLVEHTGQFDNNDPIIKLIVK